MYQLVAQKSGQRTSQGTGKADWQEVFSDGTDHPAQAGTWEEVGNKKGLACGGNGSQISLGQSAIEAKIASELVNRI